MPGVEVGPSHRHPLAPRPATRADADEVDILRSGGCRLPVDDGDRVRGPITPDQDVLAEELAVDHAVRQTVDQLDQSAVPGEGSLDERSVLLGDPLKTRLQVPAPALVVGPVVPQQPLVARHSRGGRMEPANPGRRLLEQAEIATVSEAVRSGILDEQPQVAPFGLPPVPVEPRRPERQPRQDVPVHPDLATTSAELQPANALGILELPKRVEVLEDRGKDVAGFELDVKAVHREAPALAELLGADRPYPYPHPVAGQMRQALFECFDHELPTADPCRPGAFGWRAGGLDGIVVRWHRSGRTRPSVQRCTVEGMEPFVIGHAEPSERGFDVIVGRCLGTPVTAARELPAPASTSYALRRLAAAVDACWAMIEGFCAGRPTLVHGSYRPKNILVDTSPTPLRICPVDWELAAVGPQLHDLACMANEVDHRPTIERFCEAYAEGADAFGLEVTCSDELLAELDRLRLHRVLRSLARSAEWAYPDSAVTILVDKAETIRRGLA